MRVRRRGGLRLELNDGEAVLLVDLFSQTAQLVREPGPDDADVLRRLVPDAYPDDPEASAQFRELTHDSAHDGRLARLAACLDDVEAARRAGGEVPLADEDATRRWIQALNDVRLALGTRLGITADEEGELDPADPEQHPRLVYHWLTAMQDMVVTAVMK